MQQTVKHHWSPNEKAKLTGCTKDEARLWAGVWDIPESAVLSKWERINCKSEIPIPSFNYKSIKPLTQLFVRCPVCGGTTTVAGVAYCRSCLSQWHPISLEPLPGLYLPDFVV